MRDKNYSSSKVGTRKYVKDPLSTDELIENIDIELERIHSKIASNTDGLVFQTGVLSILLGLILWRVW